MVILLYKLQEMYTLKFQNFRIKKKHNSNVLTILEKCYFYQTNCTTSSWKKCKFFCITGGKAPYRPNKYGRFCLGGWWYLPKYIYKYFQDLITKLFRKTMSVQRLPRSFSTDRQRDSRHYVTFILIYKVSIFNFIARLFLIWL